LTGPTMSGSSSLPAAPLESKDDLYVGDERWWVDNYAFILAQGYKLRPRYHPDWIPSWWTTDDPNDEYEDDIAVYMVTPALDATCINDGVKVVLKRLPNRGTELGILTLLSTRPLRSDRRNHTIPVLKVIPVPRDTWTLVVMPYGRSFDTPPFHCCNEFMEAMRQYLEGLQFMHDNNISHFDIAPQNMLMDESRIVPTGSHFVRPHTHSGFRRLFRWNNRCSVGPLDYYYIDFGLSMYFPSGKSTARALGTLRTFRTIPELSDTVPYDPFKVDIYQLGLTMDKIIQTYRALKPFEPVAAAMMNPDPLARPSAAESLAALQNIAGKMSARTLRASMWEKNGVLNHLTRKLSGGYYFGIKPELDYS
ncbi:kinase-like domain-containing protein, partial [Mycena filopes]